MITAKRLRKLVKHDTRTLENLGREKVPVVVYVDGKALTIENMMIDDIDGMPFLILTAGPELDV